MEQRTDEWHKARYGWATASRLADLMAKTKTGVSASREKYLTQVVIERITNKPYSSGFTSAAMQRGIDLEPKAICAYEIITGNSVDPVGFIRHPSIDYAGASPDGLIADDGLIEVKCPESHTHIATIETGKIDRRYMLQMQFQMACTERQWCDFVSFDDRMPGSLAVKIIRVEKDEKMIDLIESEVISFLDDANKRVAKLMEEIK
jgi:putative phage-type endonuclease